MGRHPKQGICCRLHEGNSPSHRPGVASVFAWPFVLFVVGVVDVVWATEPLLERLVGLAGLLRVSTFALVAILSGFEAESLLTNQTFAPRAGGAAKA
jgi:hypothetical protein